MDCLSSCKRLGINQIYILWCRSSGTKRRYFEKQTGEVTENKESAPKNKPEQTGKQSGEVVENTYLWKKLSENEPENEPGHVIENTGTQNSGLQQSAISAADSSPSHNLATEPD